MSRGSRTSNTGYAVADSGVIIKTTNGGYPFGLTDASPSSIHFKIYPNPSTDKITRETSTIPTNSQLFISNLSGRQLIARKITEPKTQIDISRVPNGVYIVKIMGEKGLQVGKFIKN